MNNIQKGDKLEDQFYQYLLQQKDSKELVYDVYPPELCQIHQKKKYYCAERKGDVEFDIVVEVYRRNAQEPHIIVVFECKNHSNNISENLVTDFSDKLGRIFKHNAKGVLVVSSALQSGAENLVNRRNIGVIKYSEIGFETILERKVENSYIKKSIFESQLSSKPLKFSGYYNGNFFNSTRSFFGALDSQTRQKNISFEKGVNLTIPYISDEKIKEETTELLRKINYEGGAVNLQKICSLLSIDLHHTNQPHQDENEIEILGYANFSKKEIYIHFHKNKNRERFTLSHEIGHFYLKHDQFLRSETLIASDLLIDDTNDNNFNYNQLEFQANNFASCLLLPEDFFISKINELRKKLDIKDKGHGYIYVDNQSCNFLPYNLLLSELSNHFETSKQAIEIRLKKMNWLTDNRADSFTNMQKIPIS